MGFGVSVQHPLLGASSSFPTSHTVLAQTHMGQQGEQEHLSTAVIYPTAWLWRGAGATFTSELSLLQLEAVGLQWPWHSQGGPSLVLRGGCTPQPTTPTPPMPPDSLGTTHNHPMHRAGAGDLEPLPSGCLTSENVQELVVSVAKL